MKVGQGIEKILCSMNKNLIENPLDIALFF
jgi:hypothetical protein